MPFELRDPADNAVLFNHPLNDSAFRPDDLHSELLEVDLPFGHMKTHVWIFDGIRMNYSESLFKESAVLDWKGNMKMVTMFFNLKGRLLMSDIHFNNSFELCTNQHNLFYGTEAEGKMKVEELKMKSFMIQFTEDAFLRITKGGNESLRKFADSVMKGEPAAFSQNNLDIGLAIQHCINDVIHCKYSGSLKKMFLLSKTIELLVLQAEAYDQFLLPGKLYVKNDYDRERLVYARDYLLDNIDTPPSLTQLAKTAGINEYKLKRGFKEMFGNTVFGYLSEIRLEKAKSDLLDTQKR